jgi:hypothetical protein
MISTDGIKAVPASKIQVGQLAVAKRGMVTELVMRARQEPQPGGLGNSPILIVCFGAPGGHPRLVKYEGSDADFVTLGAAAVRFDSDPTLAAFSRLDPYSSAGNLGINEHGVAFICADMRTNGVNETWVDISTGDARPAAATRWYIPAWQLGLADQHGHFHMLYERTLPTT